MIKAATTHALAEHEEQEILIVAEVVKPLKRKPRLRILPSAAREAALGAAAFDAVVADAPRKPPPCNFAALPSLTPGQLALRRDVRLGVVAKPREQGLWGQQ